MQSFIVLAYLVFELTGGQNDPPLVLYATKTLSPLRAKICVTQKVSRIFQLSYNLVYLNQHS